MMDLSLLQDFLAETGEHLDELETNLLRLETEPENKEVLNEIFRSVHTIKGSAEYLGMERIAELSHKLENLLEILRMGDHVPDRTMIDTLIAARDRISRLTADLEQTRAENTEISDIIETIDRLTRKTQSRPNETAEPALDDDTADTHHESALTAQVKIVYENLKSTLVTVSRGEVTEAHTARIQNLIDELIDTIRRLHGDSVAQELEQLKTASLTLTFADDAGDLLLSLRRLSPRLPGITDETAALETAFIEEPDETPEEASYEEEYDDELFDIFIQHLKENLAVLRRMKDALESGKTDAEIFRKTANTLGGLRSSANYMDYRKLTAFYDEWIAALENARETLEAGASPDFTFMGKNLASVLRFFPKHAGNLDQEPDAPAPEAREEAPAAETTIEETDISPAEPETESEPETYAPVEETVDALTALSDEDAMEYPVRTEAPAVSEGEPDALTEAEESPEDGEEDLLSVEGLEEDYFREETDKTPPEESAPLFAESPTDDEERLIFDDSPDETKSPTEPAEAGKTPVDTETEAVSPASEMDYRGLFDELDNAFENGAAATPEPDDAGPDLERDITGGIHPTPPEPPEPIAEVTPSPETHSETPEAEAETETAFVSPPQSPVEPKLGVKTQDLQRNGEPSAPPFEPSPERPSKQSLRVDARKIDDLMNQVGELVVSRAWFSQIYTEMRTLQSHLQEELGLNQREMKPVKAMTFRISEATVALGRVANELQEGVMKVRMLPIAQLFNRYPRLVRDLIHNTDKKVRLDVVGEETELDKMVIEEIADPLVHIIRNAVDHGCEPVRERRRLGKPEECTLRLESYHESNNVVIEITDDGRGIDPERIKEAARTKGLFSSEEMDRMSPKELLGLITLPGFSTAKTVSKTSGRGVGMDVVKKNIENLNGTIEIDSEPGAGTRFRIKIPLTLAIIQALLVRVGKEIFTIPLAAVEETLRIKESEITTIEGVEVIHLRGSTLSLIRLSDFFGIEAKSRDEGHFYVVVVNTGMRRAGIVVEVLIGQEEAVIKPLVDYLQENSGFSGATILGDGRISLILDVYELINMSIGKKLQNTDFIIGQSDATEAGRPNRRPAAAAEAEKRS